MFISAPNENTEICPPTVQIRTIATLKKKEKHYKGGRKIRSPKEFQQRTDYERKYLTITTLKKKKKMMLYL